MKKNIYRIVIANAPVNNGNRGCVALTYSILYIIDKIFKESGCEYEIYLPDSQFYDNKRHIANINNLEIPYSDCMYLAGIDLANAITTKIDFLKTTIRQKKLASNNIKEADYILDIGQGDSFSDIYGKRRFQIIDRIHKMAQKYSKPYCILPQTIGPFKDSKIKQIADRSIAKATLCMARDKQSYEYVLNNVPLQENIKEYIDVAFFMPYDKIDQDQNYIHIGLNISALLWNGGYSMDNQFGLKDDYKKIIRSLISYFLNKDNVKLHIISHVVEQERGIENDYEVAYELWREYKSPNVIIAPFALDPIEIKSYIAGMSFFMGARMHATIGAFSSGVPVVPMAYSRKFSGLFEDTLQYPYMVDLKTETKDEILNKIKLSFDNRAELKSIIESRMNTTVKEREELLYSELRKFFKINE